MRLLAVRGAHLASLGPFALELDEAPLADSRIFAIVGPTGAGKSTLLDAVCLALYDRVPRLLDARGAGIDDLGPNDPRSLMRRGAVEAYAEVDFVDRHGVRCRAHWHTWRARKRADGRVQNQKVTLHDLDAQRELTEATKTETLRQIEDRLGLSFEEFRRAVLLAQGDFAAFLRAPADERAHLLEKMTGTQLFGALSRATHGRCKRAAEELAGAETTLAALEVLSAEDRATLSTQREEWAKQRTAATGRRQQLLDMLRWHEEHQRAKTAAEVAEGAEAEARAEAQKADAEQKILDRAEAAARLQPPFDAWVRAETAVRAAEDRRKDAQTQRAKALEALTAAQTTLTEAESLQAQLRARHEAEAADVAAARDLDGRVSEARAHLTEALEQAEGRTTAATRTATQFEATMTAFEAAKAAHLAHERWLAEHHGLKATAAQWPAIEQALLHQAELSARAAAAEEALHREQGRLAQLRADRDQARSACAIAAQNLEQAQAELERGQTELSQLRNEVPPKPRREAMETLAELRAGLERLRALMPNARRLDRRIREEHRARKVATKHAKEARSQLEEARQLQRSLREDLERARAELTRAEAVQEVAQRRAELLIDGEACPLCGSTTHPFSDHAPPDNPGLSSLRARRTRLENELVQAKQATDAARAAVRTHRTEARAALNRGQQAEADLQALMETWAEGRDALKLVWLKAPLLTQRGVHKLYLIIDETPTAKGARVGLQKAVEGLDAARTDLTQWADREDMLQAAVEMAQVGYNELDAIHRQRAEAQRRLETEVTKAEHSHSQHTERRATALSEGDKVLAGVQGALERAVDLNAAKRTPDQVRTDLSDQVARYEQEQAAEQTSRAQVVQTEEALRAARAADDEATRALQEAQARATQGQTRLEGWLQSRKTHLGGQSVQAYEAAAQRARDEAETAVAKAREHLAQAASNHAATSSRHDDATSDLATAKTTHETALAGLTEALHSTGFEREELETHLRTHDLAWRAETRNRLQTVKDRLLHAQAQAEAAKQRLTTHRQTEAPALEHADASKALAESEAALEAAIATWGRLDERLRRDDEAQLTRGQLDERVATLRRQLEQWSELNAVIGSADGKKLRTFAQGLTLESLIAQANLHLEQLRPRYQLGRTPGYDMELLVIDRDLGDEVRALSSLSGGETFLVSLALALALSTMSSRNVRIESLFIDEGFGALDAEALEVALATLDQLQAEGRMIGLISHIPDLAERIGYRVEVRPTGPGTSEVRVHGA